MSHAVAVRAIVEQMFLPLLAQEVTPSQLAAPWLQQGVTGTVVIALVIVVIVLWKREASRQAKDEKTIEVLNTELRAARDVRQSDKSDHTKAIVELHQNQQELLAKGQADRFEDQRLYALAVQDMQREMLGTLRDVNQSVEGSVDFQKNLKELIDALPRRFDRIEVRLDDLSGKPRKLPAK